VLFTGTLPNILQTASCGLMLRSFDVSSCTEAFRSGGRIGKQPLHTAPCKTFPSSHRSSTGEYTMIVRARYQVGSFALQLELW
jgi:hypothetical protein